MAAIDLGRTRSLLQFFLGGDLLRDPFFTERQHVERGLGRDGHDAVGIAEDEVARLDPYPAAHDGLTEADDFAPSADVEW